jgi:hypothetical protein
VVPRSPQPDQVIQWNQEMLQLLQVPGAQPATIHPTRTMAITQLAVYDAVDAIVGGSRPYLPVPRAPRGASPDAAAAAAARTALVALLPSQHQAIDAKYKDSLAQIGSGRRVNLGIAVGIRAANQILFARGNDGSNATPPPFTPMSGPGEYQLTPPGFQQPVFTHWAAVRPFVLAAASQFRPPPPPAVTSPRYTDDFNEVRSLGELNSATRSANQTEIGRFWGAGPVQNVGADTDGNLDTVGDPNWTPLATTALDPSYPGAHAEISQSAAVALRQFFGTDRLEFSLTNPNLPGVVRSFESFSQAADEAAASRIYAGQHFRYDEDAGQALGDEVGAFVEDNIARPVLTGRSDQHGR